MHEAAKRSLPHVPVVEEDPFDPFADQVADPMEGQEHAKRHGRVQHHVLLAPLERQQPLGRPLQQSETDEQEHARHGVDRGAVQGETKVDRPVAQNRIGQKCSAGDGGSRLDDRAHQETIDRPAAAEHQRNPEQAENRQPYPAESLPHRTCAFAPAFDQRQHGDGDDQDLHRHGPRLQDPHRPSAPGQATEQTEGPDQQGVNRQSIFDETPSIERLIFRERNHEHGEKIEGARPERRCYATEDGR